MKSFFGVFSVVVLFSSNIYSATIRNPKGLVYYRILSSAQWQNVKDGLEIESNYEIKTERASSVEIHFNDGSKIKLGPQTYYKLDMEDSNVSYSVFLGKVRNWVKKHSKEYKVKTPHAVVGVRGTDFLVDVSNDFSRVEVYDGSVMVTDRNNRGFMVNKGDFVDVTMHGISVPQHSGNIPPNLDTSLADRKLMAKNEIYTEISKDEVIKRAQMEIQSAEYQSRKTAIDAYGYRVRMEEYITRPSDNQFKYVVLNTRENRFDFGKILFTFNKELPKDLTQVTRNMFEYYGNSAPSIYLTEMSSVMSNTIDKVVEEASGGRMVADDPINPTKWTHFFSNYSFYAAGKNEANLNNGKGKMLWSFSDLNNNGKYDSSEFSYLGGQKPTSYTSYPYGEDVFCQVQRNDYSDGTWIKTTDFVVFDSGKIAKTDDFKLKPGEDRSSFIDKLNFERVYESSMFSDKIDLVFSAKLLKDAGILSIK